MLKAQEEFLAVVISTNAVSFLDDRRNSAWTVAFYLDNAGNRLMAAKDLVARYDPNNAKLSYLENLPTNSAFRCWHSGIFREEAINRVSTA